MLTGYRDGHPLMARDGEPFYPFGEGFDASLTQRIEAMARRRTFEYGVDRTRVRRCSPARSSRTVSPRNTIRGWIKAFQRDGLRGQLVDGAQRPSRQVSKVIDRRDSCGWSWGEPRPSTAPEQGQPGRDRATHPGQVRSKRGSTTSTFQRIAQQYLSTCRASLPRPDHRGTRPPRSARTPPVSTTPTHPGHFAVDVTLRQPGLGRRLRARLLGRDHHIISDPHPPRGRLPSRASVRQLARGVASPCTTRSGFSMVVEGHDHRTTSVVRHPGPSTSATAPRHRARQPRPHQPRGAGTPRNPASPSSRCGPTTVKIFLSAPVLLAPRLGRRLMPGRARALRTTTFWSGAL